MRDDTLVPAQKQPRTERILFGAKLVFYVITLHTCASIVRGVIAGRSELGQELGWMPVVLGMIALGGVRRVPLNKHAQRCIYLMFLGMIANFGWAWVDPPSWLGRLWGLISLAMLVSGLVVGRGRWEPYVGPAVLVQRKPDSGLMG